MKQDISALMDGELFEDEAESLLKRVERHSDARKDWEIYHLIGDVLRQPDHIHSDLSGKVRECMRDEPTLFVRHSHAAKQRMLAFTLSAAASLSAVGVVAWMAMQIGSENSSKMAMTQNTVLPVHVQIQPKANDYLIAHQEFSPSTDMNGGASYIRTVSFRPDEK